MGSCDAGNTRNGRTRGWAIVTMGSPADAQNAIANAHGQELEGRELNVRLDQGKQIGTVVAAEVIFHADSGRSKGWGTVRFSSPAEANDAIARFGGVELAGRPMTVMMDRFN